MKKVFFPLLGLFIAIFLSLGCMSKALWEDDVVYVPYQEKLDAFMSNPQDATVVFLGEKYHYIFSKNDDFNFLLAHRTSKGLIFDVSHGYHNTNNEIVQSNFSIKVDKSIADKELVEWLEKKGYTQSKVDFPIYLEGKRYIADKKVNAVAQKLSKVFVISINEQKVDKGNIVGKILLTPLAVAGDGVLVVVGGVVLIFAGLDSVVR